MFYSLKITPHRLSLIQHVEPLYKNQNNRLGKKKKLLDSQTLFKKEKIDVCGQLFIFTFIYQLGTFLDIWICLAKQNGTGFTRSI